MEDFDILYMMKTPFYLGDLEQVLLEGQQVEINHDDNKNNALRNLYLVRALTSKGDFTTLK